MDRQTAPAFAVDIYVAGDHADALRACREYCAQGACVTVEPLEFVYTGGQEAGVRVSFKAYPRFPKAPHEIWDEAEALARLLIDRLYQDTALICGPGKHLWLNGRYDS